MLKAIVYGEEIEGRNITVLKQKASRIANRRFNAIDTMIVTDGSKELKYTRINRKCPNNTITYGIWR